MESYSFKEAIADISYKINVSQAAQKLSKDPELTQFFERKIQRMIVMRRGMERDLQAASRASNLAKRARLTAPSTASDPILSAFPVKAPLPARQVAPSTVFDPFPWKVAPSTAFDPNLSAQLGFTAVAPSLKMPSTVSDPIVPGFPVQAQPAMKLRGSVIEDWSVWERFDEAMNSFFRWADNSCFHDVVLMSIVYNHQMRDIVLRTGVSSESNLEMCPGNRPVPPDYVTKMREAIKNEIYDLVEKRNPTCSRKMTKMLDECIRMQGSFADATEYYIHLVQIYPKLAQTIMGGGQVVVHYTAFGQKVDVTGKDYVVVGPNLEQKEDETLRGLNPRGITFPKVLNPHQIVGQGNDRFISQSYIMHGGMHYIALFRAGPRHDQRIYEYNDKNRGMFKFDPQQTAEILDQLQNGGTYFSTTGNEFKPILVFYVRQLN